MSTPTTQRATCRYVRLVDKQSSPENGHRAQVVRMTPNARAELHRVLIRLRGERAHIDRIRCQLQRSLGRDRQSLLVVVFRLRIGGKVGGWISRVPPRFRASQCSAEGSDERLNDETVPANENSAGDPRELQQHGAESGVEAANVDTSGHPRRLSVLRPNVDAIAVLLAPCLELRGP